MSSKQTFSFIHVADLHLGAAFAGLTREAADFASVLEKATYTALDNLVNFARKTRPAAVLIAGDAYDRESGSVKAPLSLRDACAALGDLGISVFMVQGNHDPLDERALISWPENTHIFGSQAVEARPLVKDGETLALVHGISHNRRDVTENLATLFRRAPQDIFQIGLLHCQVGSAAGHLPYAPCGVEDLSRAGLDYWALGHVHKRGQVCARPPAHYPGNIQGLHINEDGPKGCLLVEARGKEVASVSFQALAPVQWLNLTVSLTGASKLDEAEERIREALDRATADAGVGLNGYLARLTLEGRTELDASLRGAFGRDELERLRAWGRELSPFVWIKDIQVNTAPALDMEAMERREDLLGESLRRLKAWGSDPEALARLLEKPLGDLYGPQAAQARNAGLTPPTEGELRQSLAEAAFICLEALNIPEKS